MQKIKDFVKRNKVAGKYISSGLLNTFAQTICGFVILRWLQPKELGRWQSFTVFVGYIQIFTLGTTSGLNRELPYWMGKGNEELGLKRLRTAGYFATALSIAIMFLVILIAVLLFFFEFVTLSTSIIFVLAFSTGVLSIQTNLLGATFRSAKSFQELYRIQMYTSFIYVVLLPLVYFFNIWGYIVYQVLLAIQLFLAYYYYRPFKVKYSFEVEQFKELVKVGLPIYFWNYLESVSRTIPRVVLVLFGSPLLVGLYSPAGSANAAMLNLPNYTNRYLFPTMSYKFGKSENAEEIYIYAIKAAKILFVLMFICVTLLSLIIPFIFNEFFPKYTAGILPTQITLYSGVFYSINSLFHNTLNSIKVFKPFKFIITLRIVYIISFTAVSFFIFQNLLISVAVGALVSELLNMWNYYYFLKKAKFKIG